VRAWLSSAVWVWAVQSVSLALLVALHLSLGVRARRAGAAWWQVLLAPWPRAWQGGARARVVVWWLLLGLYGVALAAGQRLR